jgi:hypothetical protein
MSNLNNGEYSPEKLWSQLSALSNGPTISGDTPNFKTDWLVLALACGMQLASELGLHSLTNQMCRYCVGLTVKKAKRVTQTSYWPSSHTKVYTQHYMTGLPMPRIESRGMLGITCTRHSGLHIIRH